MTMKYMHHSYHVNITNSNAYYEEQIGAVFCVYYPFLPDDSGLTNGQRNQQTINKMEYILNHFSVISW